MELKVWSQPHSDLLIMQFLCIPLSLPSVHIAAWIVYLWSLVSIQLVIRLCYHKLQFHCVGKQSCCFLTRPLKFHCTNLQSVGSLKHGQFITVAYIQTSVQKKKNETVHYKKLVLLEGHLHSRVHLTQAPMRKGGWEINSCTLVMCYLCLEETIGHLWMLQVYAASAHRCVMIAIVT